MSKIKEADTIPMVSVCVPTYNQEKEIRQTLDGILMQTFKDYEIIIANDASTDGTLDVCREYQAKYPDKIKIIAQENNKGVVGNSRDCLMAARGKYIAICEGDDYWIDTFKLEKQVEILESNPDVSMSHTAWTNFFVKENLYKERIVDTGDLICNSNSGFNSFCAIIRGEYRGIRFSTVMFRRKILIDSINVNDFFDTKFSTIDVGVFYVMAMYGRIHYMPMSTAVYRFNEGSVSINSDSKKAAKFDLGLVRVYFYFLNEFGASTNVKKEVLNKSIGGLCQYLFQYNDICVKDQLLSIISENKFKLKLSHRLLLLSHDNLTLKFLTKTLIRIRNIFCR